MFGNRDKGAPPPAAPPPPAVPPPPLSTGVQLPNGFTVEVEYHFGRYQSGPNSFEPPRPTKVIITGPSKFRGSGGGYGDYAQIVVDAEAWANVRDAVGQIMDFVATLPTPP
jgi:hypothetical protein